MGAGPLYPYLRDFLPQSFFLSIWLNLLIPSDPVAQNPKLQTSAFNCPLTSPIGLSSGIDINGTAISKLLHQGHSFVEIGPVVNSPEGFTLDPFQFDPSSVKMVSSSTCYGVNSIKKRLNAVKAGPRGVNLSVLKENLEIIPHMLNEDYLALYLKLYHLADFFTLNLCSDSSKDLKIYQRPYKYQSLISAITEQRNFELGLYAAYLSGLIGFFDNCPRKVYTPIYIKIDSEWQDTQGLVDFCIASGVDGIILGDTQDDEEVSQEVLKRVASQAKGKLELISYGGILSGHEVLERIKLGAKAVQILSVLLLKGPGYLTQIHEQLAQALDEQGFKDVNSAFNYYSKNNIND